MIRSDSQSLLTPRRGMVLLLVVAVLVLLALMGTVYILTADTDRQVSYATNDQANLNYATQGMLAVVRADILNSTLNSAGTPLALNGVGSPARVWTGPDLGEMNNGQIATPMEDTPSSGGTTTLAVASQPWLCGVMPWEPNTTYAPGTTVVSTILDGANPPGAAEVVCETDHFSNPASQLTGTLPTPPTGASTGNWLGRTPGAEEPLLSVLTPYLYDPADSAYDISYSGFGLNPSKTAGAGGVVYVPNASVVQPSLQYISSGSALQYKAYPFGTRDAMWNMLPYSSPNGTHYRFATRIMDLSASMNVNTGYVASANPQDTANNALYADTGAAMGAYPLYELAAAYSYNTTEATSAAAMQNANLTPPTRAGTYSTNYNLLSWQQELEYYENQGYPTSTTINLNLYGPGTELQWLAYGGAGGQFGVLANNRIGNSMVDTFSPDNSIFGTGYTPFYTTYSWSRQYAAETPTGSPAGLVTGSTQLYPARVNLNAPISTSAQAGTLAEQIANSLTTCGFLYGHPLNYVANYMDYRYGVGQQGPAVLEPSGSIINTPFGTAGTTLVDPATYYVGNAAQPFINELQIVVNKPGTTGTPRVKGYAIELLNPFGSGVDLAAGYGWELIITGGASTQTIALKNMGALSAYTGATGASYAVVYKGNHGPIDPGAKSEAGSVSPTNFPVTGTILLVRPCTGMPALGSAPANYAVVDEMNYTIAAPIPPGNTSYDASRNNATQWGCDSAGVLATLVDAGGTSDVTLGKANTIANASGGSPGVPLYDRAAGDPVDTGFMPTSYDNYQLLNWADANCIARECSTETTGGVFTPISWQIGANVARLGVPTTATNGYTPITDEQYLADLYFDFPFDSRAALTSVDRPAGALGPNVLDMFSLGTRADDPTLTLSTATGSTPYGLANTSLLTRIPGLINVNTAGEVPLYDAIYNAAAYATGSATTAETDTGQLVADTIAYRDRLAAQSNFPIIASTATTASVTATGTTPAYNTYAGNNITSLGDLLLAWLPTLEKSKIIPAIPTSFVQRDGLWAACANNFCVHSDTFAVYGLVQAIRLNPNYTADGGTYNATDWYNANQGVSPGSTNFIEGLLAPTPTVSYTSVTSSGSTTTTYVPEFILEGQRRFVAIVDSSYSTPGTSGILPAPKIVAMKILPQ